MPDYNIHIHLPTDTSTPLDTEVKKPRANLSLTERVKRCVDWRSLFAMRSNLNNVGLDIRETAGGRMVLCRLLDGEPVLENIIEDYVFLGDSHRANEEISQRSLEMIIQFIEESTSDPQKPNKSSLPNYRDNMRLYGAPLTISGESALSKAQEMHFMGRIVEDA